MSLNPVLSQDLHTNALLPFCESGEAYVLRRPRTTAILKLSTRKLTGDGDTVLTTHRLVFIKNRDKHFSKGFSSINVPYSHLEDPQFRQPVFGTNQIVFKVKSDPYATHPLESQGELSVLFNAGGAETFLRLFYKFYAQFRKNPNLMTRNVLNELEGDHVAFVDPSDPSHVYYTQPQTTTPSNDSTKVPPDPEESESQRGNRFVRFFRGTAFLRSLR